MSNMSYCRLQNTLRDLQDCNHAFSSAMEGSEEDKLSREEANALVEIVNECEELLGYMGYLVEQDEDSINGIEDLKEEIPEILDF